MKCIIRKIKYWFQRRTRGWSDDECWNLDITFLKWINSRFKKYKEKAGKIVDLEFHKFKYKGKWYISAYRMYNYDPKSKTLNKKAEKIILQIDDNGNIIVYDKNSKGYDDLLRMNVIEEDRVLYEYYSYGSYKYSSSSFVTRNCENEERTHTFRTK